MHFFSVLNTIPGATLSCGRATVPWSDCPPPPPLCPAQKQALGLCRRGISVGLHPSAVCSEPSASPAQFLAAQPCRPPCHPDGARLECTGAAAGPPALGPLLGRSAGPGRPGSSMPTCQSEGEGQSGQPLTFQGQLSWCP